MQWGVWRTTFHDTRGPIQAFRWGRFVIAGQVHGWIKGRRVGVGKDIQLVGTQVSSWRERRGHRLSIAMIPADVREGIHTLVIGTGVFGLIRCPRELREALRAQGISSVIVVPTPEACRLYNDLHRAGKRVALLAHGAC